MQVFCKTHAPDLFYILISTIEGADGHATSERHSHLQQQKIVALLHVLLFLAFTSNYKVPAQSFAIQRIKNDYILYNLQKLNPKNHPQLLHESCSKTWPKQAKKLA